ncbi:hypothetical protein F4808DRAFT_363177 [Astrocystis sublimbata]|nr:hypothetical protein F4808DRAFT_363177 [Astrocystis sublimbata]
MARQPGSGCITCRIRRVKCDEARPRCRRCHSAKRACDGYLPHDAPLSRRALAAAVKGMSSLGPASRALSQVPDASPSQSQSQSQQRSPLSSEFMLFDLFRLSTGPSTASFMGSPFWGRDLLQLAHSERAIWHATVALAALQRRFELEAGNRNGNEDADTSLIGRDAEMHYMRAITLGRQLRDLAKVLALSLALGAAADVMGRLAESHLHIMAARRMLTQQGTTEETLHATKALAGLDLEAMSYGDITAPYQYEDTVPLRRLGLGREGVNCRIDSYEDASAGLMSLARSMQLLGNEQVLITGDLTPGSIQHDLLAWENGMAQFEARQAVRFSRNNLLPALSLRLYDGLVRSFVLVSQPGPETKFDAALGLFARMVVLARAILQRMTAGSVAPLALEPGLIIPLFVVGSKCRHPRVRRRALGLLQQMNRQEGVWRSDAIATAVAQIIRIEEQLADDVPLGIPHCPACVGQTTLSDSVDGSCPVSRQYDQELKDTLSVPWETWSRPLSEITSSSESWDGVPVIPELCRVVGFAPMLSTKKRRFAGKFLMSSGHLQGGVGSVKEFSICY